ncbi:deleted in autism protein 1 homolog [Lingula anatina]|uniref:Deleted in autism protein 1 homolog n=1 Tax=Lingula anatina TaxID=7574 RepID=A0A1S3J7I3_LINAN|nr:deleted in autism protein 1 homolog [Lingula anatina]|eukprot:XP_013406196.1 deleted in autism protein 1 homolog [Lingula anatina]
MKQIKAVKRQLKRHQLCIMFGILCISVFVTFYINYFAWKKHTLLKKAADYPAQFINFVRYMTQSDHGFWFWKDGVRKYANHLQFLRGYLTDQNLTHVPNALTKQSTCPACFGEDACSAISNGDVKILKSNNGDMTYRGVYFGKWDDKDIVLKQLVTDHEEGFKNFDKFLCKHSQKRWLCRGPEVIKQTFIGARDAMKLENLAKGFNITREGAGLKLCLTTRFIRKLQQLYDIDDNNKLSAHESSIMYTSLVVNPEAALLKFFSSLDNLWPFPKYYGACGRAVIAENGGKPLVDYLNQPWEIRASLALQLLEVVQYMLHGDPNWSVFYVDINYDNIAITSSEKLSFIDLEDLTLLDKKEFDQGETEVRRDKPCNEECFGQFAAAMYGKNARDFCSTIPIYSDVMFALVCQKILSDLEEHKKRSWFTDPKIEIKSPDGLLHSIPYHFKTTIEKSLRECVEEREVDGRIQAVEYLRGALVESLGSAGGAGADEGKE